MRNNHWFLFAYVILLAVTVVGLFYIGENLSSTIAIVIIALSWTAWAYCFGHYRRLSIDGRNISSFKHEAQNALLMLRMDRAKPEDKYTRVIRLTESMLLFNIETKVSWPERRYIDVEDNIFDTLNNYTRYAENHGVKLQAMIAPCPHLKFNREALNYALTILISNAISVTPTGASVVIRGVSRQGLNRYELSIEDAGGGVSNKIRSQFIRSSFIKSSRIHDVHLQRCYGMGLNCLKRLCKKTNLKVDFPQKGHASAVVIIPIA
ncbi:hypothetical protein ACRZ5S_22325 (plasmid) [Vibrio scophthalmi]|uniref:hypothetical protein n=1 Tax=Vibrio scophthalmi TaxID=45658 RepID=UPI003EBC7EEB